MLPKKLIARRCGEMPKRKDIETILVIGSGPKSARNCRKFKNQFVANQSNRTGIDKKGISFIWKRDESCSA